MGTGFVEVPLETGADADGAEAPVVVFQVDDAALTRNHARRTPEKLKEDAVGRLNAIAEAAELVHDSLKERLRPDSVEMEISVGLSAEVGWFVAKSTAEGSLKLKFTWDTVTSESDEPESESDGG